jgi:hypothetical protein
MRVHRPTRHRTIEEAAISTPSPEQSAFEPAAPEVTYSESSWTTDNAKASLKRISSASTVDRANAQAVTEAVVLLHSIRRILMWTAVIIPLLLLAAGIVLMVVAAHTS